MAPRPLIESKPAHVRGASAVVSVDEGGKYGASHGSQSRTHRMNGASNHHYPTAPSSSQGSEFDRERTSTGSRDMRRMNPAGTVGGPAMSAYGGYGMMPMMGMGYGYGYGGMGYGGMGMMGPMGMIYSINYFIATIGQFASMLGMSTHAVGHLLTVARTEVLRLEKTVRHSEWRRWLQRKAEKSPLLRWALIIASMLAATQVVRLARYLIETQLRRTTGSTGGLLTNASASAVNAGALASSTVGSTAASALTEMGLGGI